MTDDDATDAALIKASSLLLESSERLAYGAETDTDTVPHLLAEATRRYDTVARKLSPDDAETAATAATVAVGRSTTAALALQQCALDELDCGWSWTDGTDGPYLGDMEEYDEDGLSEELTARAVEAAREALDADPGDPLVPLQLGHALCWSGDRDGAVAAYAEALRRDPGDHVARDSLAELGEEVPEEDDLDGTESPSRFAFALVREEARISNSEWSSIACVFGSVDAARRDADETLKSCDNGGFDPEDLPTMLKLTLEIHRPGQPITRFPVEPLDASFLIDWSGLPEGEPLDPPLPPGRPVRIDGETCFHGGLR